MYYYIKEKRALYKKKNKYVIAYHSNRRLLASLILLGLLYLFSPLILDIDKTDGSDNTSGRDMHAILVIYPHYTYQLVQIILERLEDLLLHQNICKIIKV